MLPTIFKLQTHRNSRMMLLSAAAAIAIATSPVIAAPITETFRATQGLGDGKTPLPPEAKEAFTLAQRGDFAGAAKILRPYVQQHPDQPGTRDVLARLLLAQGDATGAEAVLTEKGRMTDQTPGLWVTYGNVLLAQGKPVDARKAFDKAAMLDPVDVISRLILARIDAQAGADDAAEKRYRAILAEKLVPHDQVTDVHMELAAFLGTRNRLDDVVALLSPLLKQNPAAGDRGQIAALQAIATAHISAGRVKEAETALATLDKMGAANDPEVRLMRASVAERRGDAAGAIQILRTMENDQSPAARADIWRAALRRAALHQQRKEWDEAKKAAMKAAETVPQGAALEAGHAAVDVYFAANSGKESLPLIDALQRRFPAVTGLPLLLGETQLAVGDGPAAMQTAEAVIKRTPDDGSGWMLRGHAAWLNKDAKDALSSLEKATALSPRVPLAWIALSTLHHQMEGHEAQHRDSRPVLERALKAIPGNVEIASRLAEMDWEDGKPAAALERYRQILTVAPTDPVSLLALGRAAAYRAGGLAEAKAMLAKAKSAPAAAKTAAHLEAVIAIAEKNPKKAKDALSALVAQAPGDGMAALDLAVAQDGAGDGKAASETATRALQLGLFSDDAARARAMLTRLAGDKTAEVKMGMIGGAPIGTVALTDTAAGLRIKAQLNGLPTGNLGFHVHAVPDCSPGNATHAMHMAGGHFNGLLGQAALQPGEIPHAVGDLPPLAVNDKGASTAELTAGRLRVDMIRGRALLIHAAPDGVFGNTANAVACGLVPAS